MVNLEKHTKRYINKPLDLVFEYWVTDNQNKTMPYFIKFDWGEPDNPLTFAGKLRISLTDESFDSIFERLMDYIDLNFKFQNKEFKPDLEAIPSLRDDILKKWTDDIKKLRRYFTIPLATWNDAAKEFMKFIKRKRNKLSKNPIVKDLSENHSASKYFFLPWVLIPLIDKIEKNFNIDQHVIVILEFIFKKFCREFGLSNNLEKYNDNLKRIREIYQKSLEFKKYKLHVTTETTTITKRIIG